MFSKRLQKLFISFYYISGRQNESEYIYLSIYVFMRLCIANGNSDIIFWLTEFILNLIILHSDIRVRVKQQIKDKLTQIFFSFQLTHKRFKWQFCCRSLPDQKGERRGKGETDHLNNIFFFVANVYIQPVNNNFFIILNVSFKQKWPKIAGIRRSEFSEWADLTKCESRRLFKILFL